MQEVRSLIVQIADIGLSLIALALVVAVIFGGPVPFLAAPAANLTGLAAALAAQGAVGLAAAGLIVWLFVRLGLVPAAAPASPARRGRDDLKKIAGVGPTIERKLRRMGWTRYEQIAGWSAADIAAVDAALRFRGRIGREKWVEQAATLAAGGETEFSRRVRK